MAVTLNAIPAPGDDLEDFVAALFQSAGYFVEKSLTKRDPTDVLELDIVATTYVDPVPRSLVAEVKGGDWGYPELFKVIGWMRYLGLDRGAFFVAKDAGKDIVSVANRMASLDLSLVHFDTFDDPGAVFASAGLGTIGQEEVVAVWRHSYAVERKLAKVLIDRARAEKNQPAPAAGPAVALAHHRLVTDGVFFEETVLTRLHALYDAYKDHPKLSLACAVEASGGSFDPDVQAQPNDMMREAMRYGEHPFLQACFYTEHRARVALLKAAVDFACENPSGFPAYDPAVLTHDSKLDMHYLWLHALPQTFKDGITWLVQQPTFRRYALFWQQFLWGWGGFYLDDRAEHEFKLMSATSGIPPDEIPVALEAFDRLFPTPAQWLVTPGQTCARRLKLVPTYFQGIGVYHRQLAYDWTDLSEMKGSGYTAHDMAIWNNATVSFLT